MTTQTFEQRINDTNKTQLAESFIHKIKATASATKKSQDEVYQMWCAYSATCKNADQSALFSEFCEWNKLPIID